MCRKLCHFIWGIWWFHRSKHFEAMKAGKLAIRPWLSCPYNKTTLEDLPPSVLWMLNLKSKSWMDSNEWICTWNIEWGIEVEYLVSGGCLGWPASEQPLGGQQGFDEGNFSLGLLPAIKKEKIIHLWPLAEKGSILMAFNWPNNYFFMFYMLV